MTTSTPKPRPFRYSLRALLSLVVVLSVAVGWLILEIKTARRQREVEAPFRELGGGVSFSHPHHLPVILRNPGDMRGIHFYDTGFTDADLKRLKTLLDKHPHLGLTLQLDGAKVTDAGLAHLAGITSLGFLSLDNTQISDTGLVHLGGMTRLSYLSLDNTQISDTGLMHLAGMTKLTYLSLDNTKISDNGLMHLERLTGLEELRLRRTQMTDAGLKHLEELTYLHTLYTGGNEVSEEGVEKLQKALPNCKIYHY